MATVCHLAAVQAVAFEVMGTIVEATAPLMSAGLDSIATTAFVSTLASRLSVDLAPTALFDHPTLESIASFVSNEVASDDSKTRALVLDLTCQKALTTRSNVVVVAWSLSLAGRASSRSAVRDITTLTLAANTRVPATRWE